MSEHIGEIDALLRDLRNPMIDVAESDAALAKYVRERMAQAWEEGWEVGHDTDAYYASDANYQTNPYRFIPPGGGGGDS